jgi:hypothetical protein
MRVCRKCNVNKPETEFYKNPSKSNPDRLRGDCKDCHQVKTATQKKIVQEKYREYWKKYSITNASKITDARLRRVYGITLEQFTTLLDKQDGKCAICKQIPPLNAKGFSFAIDHDHACCNSSNARVKGYSCGKCVRGLLCHNCNLGLGNFKDSINLLQTAIDYLKGN